MSTIKVSAMTLLPAVSATHTYGVTGAVSEGKVAVNDIDGLAIFNGTDLMPYADNACALGGGALRFNNLYGNLTFAVAFSNGSVASSFSYSDGVGPRWKDRVTTNFLTFNVQSLSTNRTVTWPDAAGTVTLLGNASTGSGSVVLATAPTMTNPVVGTQAVGDNSTKAASTAFVLANTALVQRAAPATGATVTVTTTKAATKTVFIRPAGTLATLTVQVDDGSVDGQLLTVVTSQIITALTITGNVDLSNNPIGPTFAAGESFTLSWDATAGTWVVLNIT